MAIPKKTTSKPAEDAASTPVPLKKPTAVTPKAPVAARKPVVAAKTPVAARKPVAAPKKPVPVTPTPAAVALERSAAAHAAAAAKSAPAAPAIKHVWTKEDTYADLAFKYYGSIKKPYWTLIYEHNKAIIGEHPNDIRVGLEIEIPPLPEELKQK